MFGNRGHFRELLAGSEEKIASNILADRLRRLTDAGRSPATTPAPDSGPPTASPKPRSSSSRY